ncbi:aldehyde dehydrogenase family protein [Tumidithrix helvetica PCC 7403]|uniref:aldehyde dehydrogenase family protein n=1 Tax=Tumidithrix helvetica TaxID=3457545 RepID=UPI003C8B7A97
MPPEDLTGFVYQSHAAATQLAQVKSKDRNQLILDIAKAVKLEKDRILEANTLDLEASRDMAIPDLVLEWLKLTPERLQHTIECLTHLAAMVDPLAIHMNYEGYRRVPIGTVAFVYEGFPQLGLIAACMCFKVGNSIILKGGIEGSHSHTAIAQLVKTVLRDRGLSESSLTHVPQGSSIKDLVTQEKYLRLVIPYGRPSFVQQVSKQSTIALLPTVMGNCYMYISPSGDLNLAQEIILNSRKGEPDPVNAIEKIIVHRSWLDKGLAEWIDKLQKQGLVVRGCDTTAVYYYRYTELLNEQYNEADRIKLPPNHGEIPSEGQWGLAYLDNTIAIKVVDSIDEAIAWINQYSSGHADVILTDSLPERHKFSSLVNSSTLYINAHNRFYRFGTIGESGMLRIALGMSSLKSRGASRYPGMIDLYALTTTKHIITGN